MQANMDDVASFSSQAPQSKDLWGGPLSQYPYDYTKLQLALNLGLDKTSPSLQLGNKP